MADCTPFCDPCRNCCDANEAMRKELSQAKADLAKAHMNEAHEHAASMDYALDAGARNAARVAHYEKLADTWKARAERAEARVEAQKSHMVKAMEILESSGIQVRGFMDWSNGTAALLDRTLKSEALAKEQERVIGDVRAIADRFNEDRHAHVGQVVAALWKALTPVPAKEER